MPNILIIGATRGLGASLANLYASTPSNTVYGTTRSPSGPKTLNEKIVWVPNIDVSQEGVGASLVNQLGQLGVAGGMIEGENEVRGFDIVVITAGYFATEDFANGPKWAEQVKMYSASPYQSLNKQSQPPLPLLPPSINLHPANTYTHANPNPPHSHILHLPTVHNPLPHPRKTTPQRFENRASKLRIRQHSTETRQRGRRELRAPCQQSGVKHGWQAAEFGSEGARGRG